MSPEMLPLVLDGALIIVAAGAAYGGVKRGLNGLHIQVKRVEDKLDRIETQVQDNRVEISGIKSQCVAFHPELRT